jgi:hypothetical protein
MSEMLTDIFSFPKTLGHFPEHVDIRLLGAVQHGVLASGIENLLYVFDSADIAAASDRNLGRLADVLQALDGFVMLFVVRGKVEYQKSVRPVL